MPSIAIILPAFNEELTISETMKDFFRVCPDAHFYVVNNGSTDKTRALALETFADLGCRGRVIEEPRNGKAYAVRRAFMEINADLYVLADSDMTYPADDLPDLLAPVLSGQADMVCGNRHQAGNYRRENTRRFHDFGNRLVCLLINALFRGHLQDILTGYRVLSKRFVKNYPVLSAGFEIETEMSIHALDKGYSVVEVPTKYRNRPEGSVSKLNTVTDGVLIIKTIFSIFVKYRPLLFFFGCALLFALSALSAGSVPVIEYIQTGTVLHVPLAILASGLSILAMISFAVAVILDGIASAQRFNHALALLHWQDITRDS